MPELMKIQFLFLISTIILFNLHAQSSQSIREKLTSNVWGLHGILTVNDSEQTEERQELGDSDVRLRFSNDGTLTELEEGIKRMYRWEVKSDSTIVIHRTPTEKKERFNSFLKLEEVNVIKQLNDNNLILQTHQSDSISYKFHYKRDDRFFE